MQHMLSTRRRQGVETMRRRPTDEAGGSGDWYVTVIFVVLVVAILALITFELWAPHEIPWW